jgi:tetratricopeptide (TPR) repeat protein
LARLESLGARLLWNESFQVQQVDLSQTDVRDDDLALLQRMPAVESLLLSETAISDAGLVHLRSIPELKFVDLSHTQVTDDGLTRLSDLPKLRSLQLHGTQTNQSSLNSFQSLRSPDALGWLTASYAAVRARGVPHQEEAELRQREISDYERILKDHPEQTEALYRVATQRLALERLWAKDDVPHRTEIVQSAITELTQLTKLIGDSEPAQVRIRAHHQLGRAWKHQGDLLLETTSLKDKARESYDAALAQFQQVLKIDPDQVDAIGEIVLVYLSQDDVTASLAAVREHLKEARSSRSQAKLHVMLGELLARDGQLDNAIDNLKLALKSDERAMDAYLVLFRLIGQRDGPKAAIDVLRRAVETEPRFVNGHLQLGQLLVQQEDADEAIAAFESVLRVPTSDAVVLGMVPSPNVFRNQLYYQAAAWLAWLYMDSGDDPERALQAVAAAKTFQPADAHLLDTEGWIYVRKGDYQRGRDLLLQAAKQNDSPTTSYHLAQAHFALGQWAASEQCLQRALETDAPFPERAAAAELLTRARNTLSNREGKKSE